MVASGMYVVKEEGLQFEHTLPGSNQKLINDDEPTTPEEFLERFRNKFVMRVLERPDEHHLVLELINVDVSFVNALRRILLAEVPTVALENIYMWHNNSMIHDEVLSHRLGLIPLNIDARLLDDPDENDPVPTDRNTVVFRLAVSCTHQDKEEAARAAAKKEGIDLSESQKRADLTNLIREEDRIKTARDDSQQQNTDLEEIAKAAAEHVTKERPKFQYPKDRPYTKHVYSKDLVWVPQGEQEEMFPDGIRPIHDDILIAKLREGQSIELEAHGQRGIGKDHAKYSPVCTASYRLMPHIEIVRPIYDDDADELCYIYEPGVFDIKPTDPKHDPPGKSRKAVVVNPYACTMSRNYMRNPTLASSIVMKRLSNHFIFSIESVGMYSSPGVLFAEALRVLQRKCTNIIDLIEDHTILRADMVI